MILVAGIKINIIYIVVKAILVKTHFLQRTKKSKDGEFSLSLSIGSVIIIIGLTSGVLSFFECIGVKLLLLPLVLSLAFDKLKNFMEWTLAFKHGESCNVGVAEALKGA